MAVVRGQRRRELTAALQSIFGDILQSGSTFVAPAVSVNAFNRTQSSNELYVSVFKPDDTLRWPGNVKKYGIRDGQIVDATGADAIDRPPGSCARAPAASGRRPAG